MSIASALRLSKSPAAAFAVVGLYWGSFAAQAPQIKTQIGADDRTFGLLLLGTSLGLMTTMFLAPIVDRKLGPRAMQVACMALVAAFLLPGLATGPVFFLCAMVGAGLASGLSDVIMNARVSELEAAHRRPLMNANHGMFSVAYAASAFCTGLAREADASSFAIFAGVGVVALILVTRMAMPVAEVPDDAEGNGVKFPVLTVLLCGAVVLVAFMTEAAIETWSALHVERTLGGRAAEGALGPAMLGLTMALGRFGGQAVSERLSDLAVILAATALSIVGVVIAALARTPLEAYLGFGTVGLGVSVIGPLGLAIVGRLVPEAVRTKAISRAALIGFMGFFVAPAVMGMVSGSYSLRTAFLIIAVLLFLLFPLVAVLKRRGA